MSRLANLTLTLVVLAWPIASAAQTVSRLETFLEENGLKRMLALHLADEYENADPGNRLDRATRLAEVYVSLISQSATDEDRRSWESAAERLVDSAPDQATRGLRLELASSRFKAARRVADSSRLGLASAEEITRATRELRAAARELSTIGQRAHQESETLEARVRRQLPEEEERRLRELRQTALGDRSRAMYLAGWSEYYLGWLTEDPQRASVALVRFGWLLGADANESASVVRLERGRLAFAHVAESALGCALSNAMLSRDTEAVAWLNAVDETENLDPAVAQMVLPVRIMVLASASRWEDLDVALRRARLGGTKPLEPRVAHLAALEALTFRERESSGSIGGGFSVQAAADRVATAGLSDLVTAGRVPLVLDIVERFGTDLLGDEGFVVYYVRAIRSLARARELHASDGSDANGPATSAATANAYRAAADLFRGALSADDADSFEQERSAAATTLGLALFLAGDLDEASERLGLAFRSGFDDEQRQEALWYLLRARRHAVTSGRQSLRPELNRLGQLYVVSFPATERSSRILLDPEIETGLGAIEAARALLNVPPDSPLYANAQSRAASMLYRAIATRTVSDTERARALFVGVVSARLPQLRASARGQDEAATAARDEFIRRSRQLLDVLLGSEPAMPTEADAVLAALRRFTTTHGGLDTAIESELVYRELQIALSRGDAQRVSELGDALRDKGGSYAQAARSLMFNWASKRWREMPDDAERAATVVRFGLPLVEQIDPNSMTSQTAAIAAQIAGAAEAVYQSTSDSEALATAIRMDAALVEASLADQQSVRRYATFLEEAGDIESSLEAWRTLASALPNSDEGWFEARYHTIRIVAVSDAARARRILDQHNLLHPSWGPPSWSDRFVRLDSELPASYGSSGGGG